MTKEDQIQEYIDRIYKAKSEIEICENQINILNDLTEICPLCNGEGKIMTIHRFMPPHEFMICRICKGVGKVTKEELETYNRNEVL